ncbi:hypothetical protein GIB67_001673 [Kingdonia uniflora]|uniref:Uncharacterized protein n=1 Tax=Kingdonia uniflora TaxID=39325 RepID=A0A7J7P5W5_9MAGN|nr:hypothetical protein GIB67_008768 [Kingdonia uniflora]KAF6176476.1 hypothetical protein GIB67_001673 [Kingdonia uniflora]
MLFVCDNLKTSGTSTKAFLKGVDTWIKETIFKKEDAKHLEANDIGYYLGDTKENCSTYRGTRTRAAVVFIIGFWLLDLANNTVQGPARALLADLSGPDQQNSTNAIFCFWMAVRNIFGFSAGFNGNWHSIIATHSDGSVYKTQFRGGLVAVVKEVRIFNEAKDAFNKEVQLLMRLHHQLL